jgi:hypothetical protein
LSVHSLCEFKARGRIDTHGMRCCGSAC